MLGGWWLVFCVLAQAPDPAQLAYEALRVRDYDRAVGYFQQAVAAAPGRVGIRKDLAYTYLKIGEREAAREQFAEAMRLDPADSRVALEYAFLCYETKRQAEARRVFDRLRRSGDATAEQAFQNIDRPLAEGIARWSEVVARTPGDYSAQLELARLAEQRDELKLAAEHYERAWRVRPAERALLLDLGRVWKALGRAEQANAALLAASRGSPPRVSEAARELLGSRYPYVPEFRRALELDPGNLELQRELAYLLLEMGKKQEAEAEFRAITERAPADLLSAAQLGFLRQQQRGVSAKEMGERSYRAGYLKDALRYFEAAHEADPADSSVMLKLGWTYNLLRQDERAISWFDLARRSPDPVIAAEATRAYRKLRPALARVRTTAWLFPFFSSRWRDVFSYGQIKTELRLGRLPFRPYLSTRFIGDTRRTTGEALPQYLSESSFLFAVGLASRYWHGLMLWGEAGEAVSYLRRERGRMVPDYRGGIAYGRGAGRLLGAESPGWFAETHEDGVFLSRFQDDFLLYAQNQAGYTLPARGGLLAQVYLNANVTLDARRQYWANFVEFGPGARFHWKRLPESLVFSVNLLRGVYTRNTGNPRGPNFVDVRVGVWYAR